MFYLLTAISLLAFATGCEEEKKDEAVVADYTTSGDISLGANGNATLKTGFDIETLTPISTASTTAADQAKVDLLFLNDDATVSAFYAPSAVLTGTVTTWTTKNATNFKVLTGFTSAQWDALKSAQNIQDAYTSSASVASNKGADVTAGKYYAVKTVGNKYSVISIKSFVASSTGSTTINVKVQN